MSNLGHKLHLTEKDSREGDQLWDYWSCQGRFYMALIQGRNGGHREKERVRRDVWSENLQDLVKGGVLGRDG